MVITHLMNIIELWPQNTRERKQKSEKNLKFHNKKN